MVWFYKHCRCQLLVPAFLLYFLFINNHFVAAQALVGTSWRSIGTTAASFKQSGYDTLVWQFQQGNRLHWVGTGSSGTSTIYSLWWQTGPQSFSFTFQDTTANTSLLSSLCPHTDTMFIKAYHITIDTLKLDMVMGGCSVVNAVLVGSQWLGPSNVAVNNMPENQIAVTIFPNPASQSIVINTGFYFQKSKEVQLSLYDDNGRKVKAVTASPGIVQLNNLGDLPAGLYMLRINSETSLSYSQKVILRQ